MNEQQRKKSDVERRRQSAEDGRETRSQNARRFAGFQRRIPTAKTGGVEPYGENNHSLGF